MALVLKARDENIGAGQCALCSYKGLHGGPGGWGCVGGEAMPEVEMWLRLSDRRVSGVLPSS